MTSVVKFLARYTWLLQIVSILCVGFAYALTLSQTDGTASSLAIAVGMSGILTSVSSLAAWIIEPALPHGKARTTSA
jgi:hypothetical protein